MTLDRRLTEGTIELIAERAQLVWAGGRFDAQTLWERRLAWEVSRLCMKWAAGPRGMCAGSYEVDSGLSRLSVWAMTPTGCVERAGQTQQAVD
jgi:hypothetical protein